MTRTTWRAIVSSMATVSLASGRSVEAQATPTQGYAMQPRAIADSTFAAALAVNDLAEEIRRGTLSQRAHNDPVLRQAVEELSQAGARRSRPKFLEKVPLWDFSFDSLAFQPAGRSELLVIARAHFTRDSSSARRVTLHVRRNGTEWRVVGYGQLREYFIEQRQKAKGGPLK